MTSCENGKLITNSVLAYGVVASINILVATFTFVSILIAEIMVISSNLFMDTPIFEYP